MDLHKYGKHIRSNLAILTVALCMAFLLMWPDILDHSIFESQPWIPSLMLDVDIHQMSLPNL